MLFLQQKGGSPTNFFDVEILTNLRKRQVLSIFDFLETSRSIMQVADETDINSEAIDLVGV